MFTIGRRALLAGLAAGPARAAAPPLVIASFSILADLVREVAGGRVRVVALVGPDRDLHAYRPRPSDLRLLAGAALLVLNGLGAEGWAARMASASGFAGRVVVASDGVVPWREGPGAVDPHAWQDVGNVRLYVSNISNGLAAIDPAGAAAYREAAAAYRARLDGLDAEIRAALAAIPAGRRRIVTSHDALGYFGRAYGLTVLAPLGLSDTGEPSARAVAALERQIRREHIRALFVESFGNAALLRQIAHDTGARIGGTLHTDALSPPDGPAGTYIAMMRHNLATIIAALR